MLYTGSEGKNMEKSCYIVGGGPSLSSFDYSLLDGKDVIAVNQAFFHVPKPKYFITMDYTWVLWNGIAGEKKVRADKRREFMRHPAEKFFVVGFSGDRLRVIDNHHIVDTEHGIMYDLNPFDQVVHAAAYGGLGRSLKDFHCGSDSGYAGLQLAVALGYTEIYLLGYDFCATVGGTHFHNDYTERDWKKYDAKLKEFMTPYPMALDVARKELGVRVYSCSTLSRLNRYIPFRKVGRDELSYFGGLGT
jgi:hypothetical protein